MLEVFGISEILSTLVPLWSGSGSGLERGTGEGLGGGTTEKNTLIAALIA